MYKTIILTHSYDPSFTHLPRYGVDKRRLKQKRKVVLSLSVLFCLVVLPGVQIALFPLPLCFSIVFCFGGRGWGCCFGFLVLFFPFLPSCSQTVLQNGSSLILVAPRFFPQPAQKLSSGNEAQAHERKIKSPFKCSSLSQTRNCNHSKHSKATHS